MFTVKIEVNGQVILARSANRLAGEKGELCLYATDDGQFIEHHYDAGAAVLAVRMLASVKNTLRAGHQSRITRWLKQHQ